MRTVEIKEAVTDHIVISVSLAELGRLYWAAKNHEDNTGSAYAYEADAAILGEILRERGRVDAADIKERSA